MNFINIIPIITWKKIFFKIIIWWWTIWRAFLSNIALFIIISVEFQRVLTSKINSNFGNLAAIHCS